MHATSTQEVSGPRRRHAFHSPLTWHQGVVTVGVLGNAALYLATVLTVDNYSKHSLIGDIILFILFVSTFVCAGRICFVESSGQELDKSAPETRPINCTACNLNVSRCSKHCQACNKCVFGFDHHCVWLNSCIGVKTYKTFVATCVLQIVYSILKIVLLGAVVLPTDHSKRIIILSCIQFLLDTLLLVSLVDLMVFHAQLRLKGMTTFQYIMEQREKAASKTELTDMNVIPSSDPGTAKSGQQIEYISPSNRSGDGLFMQTTKPENKIDFAASSTQLGTGPDIPDLPRSKKWSLRNQEASSITKGPGAVLKVNQDGKIIKPYQPQNAEEPSFDYNDNFEQDVQDIKIVTKTDTHGRLISDQLVDFEIPQSASRTGILKQSEPLQITSQQVTAGIHKQSLISKGSFFSLGSGMSQVLSGKETSKRSVKFSNKQKVTDDNESIQKVPEGRTPKIKPGFNSSAQMRNSIIIEREVEEGFNFEEDDDSQIQSKMKTVAPQVTRTKIVLQNSLKRALEEELTTQQRSSMISSLVDHKFTFEEKPDN